jgi:hypothetical protein
VKLGNYFSEEEGDMGGRKFRIFASLAMAFCAEARGQQPAAVPVSPADEYELKWESDVVGTVVAFAANSKTAPFGARATVQTNSGLLEVHLGDANHFSIETGDRLRIVGETLPAGGSLFVARIVQKGTRGLEVRTAGGFPIPYVAPRNTLGAASRRGMA